MHEPEPAARGSARIALTSVFLAPTRCFQEIGRGASWLAPFVLTALLAVAGVFLMRPLQEAAMRDRMAKAQQGNPNADMSGFATAGFVISLVTTPFGVLAMTALSGGVFFLVFRVARLGIGYKRVFTGLAYAGVVGAGVPNLLLGLLLHLKARAGPIEGVDDMPRIGLDLLGGEGVLRGVLASISPFGIWWLVVLLYGFAALAGRAPGRMAAPVLAAGLLWLLGSGALNGLASFGGG